MKSLASRKVAQILNRAIEGGGLHSIGKDIGVNRAQVWKVLKDFPLWDFIRKPDKYKIDN